MAVSRGEIVEVNAQLPHEHPKPHMVLVVSGPHLQQEEDGMFYGVMITSRPTPSEYKIEIKPDMLVRPLSKQSYFATHLMTFYTPEEIVRPQITRLKMAYMEDVINKVIDSVFECE